MLPVNLTLTPSPRCNSRCSTCNIWRKREDELSLEEWDRTLQSIGSAPFWFTVSGGEPFLYQELVPLCELAYEHCRPEIINVPTNGLLYRRIPGLVDRMCEACPETEIIINLSLDGVREKHDAIRRVPGNFERLEKTYRALREMDHSNLTVGIHSVISRLNVQDMEELVDYALEMEPDSYITEIAEERVELDTVGEEITPSVADYSAAIDQLIARLKEQQFGGISRITEAFRVEYYGLVKRILAEERQVIPCFAGTASAQIYANGDVWPCCVRADRLGNLREVDYDFKRIWFSDRADRVRDSIRAGDCHCPLANAGYTNMLMHLPTLGRVSARVMVSSVPKQFTGTDRFSDSTGAKMAGTKRGQRKPL
jgi:MoaA/NifB/PqqE/SkfB family radical SAM enzyme